MTYILNFLNIFFIYIYMISFEKYLKKITNQNIFFIIIITINIIILVK